MRNLILILTFTLLITALSGCSSVKESKVIIEEQKAVEVLMTKHNTMNVGNIYNILIRYPMELQGYTRYIDLFKREFSNNTDFKINYKLSNSNSYEEYVKNRNLELHLEEGPELILITGGEDYQSLIREGVALKIDDKIPNYNNIYDSLKDGYFVPIAMAVNTFALHNNALEILELLKPSIDWTEDEFHNIMDVFYQNGSTYITPDVVHILINNKLKDNSLYLSPSGEINLTNNELVRAIEDIRYQLRESSRFKQRTNYNYDNYLRMLYYHEEEHFDYGIVERGDIADVWRETIDTNPYIHVWSSTNSLNSLETYSNKFDYSQSIYARVTIEDEDITLLPRPYPSYSSWGFIVNKNAKNIEEALVFLDLLLSDSAQLRLYTEIHDNNHLLRSTKPISFSAPVVKTIEEEIMKLDITEGVAEDIINLRKETLRQIIEGERTRNYRGSSLRGAYIINTKEPLSEVQERFFKEELEKIIVKVVFGDKRYNSEEIMKELRELDNRMRLVLSE